MFWVGSPGATLDEHSCGVSVVWTLSEQNIDDEQITS